jgi:hypothetical protein
VRIVKPRFGDVEPAVEKSVTVSRRINQEDSLLAISEFAQRSAILPLHADRMFPFLRKTATVNDHCSIRLSEVCSHQLLMSLQNSIIVPSPFADKLLHGLARSWRVCRLARFHGLKFTTSTSGFDGSGLHI